jgi:hypothetical protein
MIAHVVLFKPRRDLSSTERADLVNAFSRALSDIPSIHRATIGRRVTHGRGYEQLMTVDYEYAAILEFDDLAALEAYLQHPAHEQLANRFFAAFETALMYDYQMKQGAEI